MNNEYSSKAEEVLDNFFLDIKASANMIMENEAQEEALKQLTDLITQAQSAIERTWYVVDKDAFDKQGDIIIGPFTTDTDAAIAREYIERKDAHNHTFWLEQREKNTPQSTLKKEQ